MSTYTVAFQYRIEDVAGPLEAAERAYAIVTDFANMRPIATVTSEDGHSEEIDLDAEES